MEAQPQPDPLRRLAALVLSLFLAIMIGWLLLIGKGLLMPIVVAVLSVYVISSAANALGRWPGTRSLPDMLRKALVLLGFVAVLAVLNGVVILTARDLMAQAPAYQDNIEKLIVQAMRRFGIDGNPDWQAIRDVTIDRIDMQRLIGGMAGSVGAMVGGLVMAAVYAMFLTAEASGFGRKLAVALPGQDRAGRTLAVIKAVNARIGDYLAIKTLINVILGAISYAILWLAGVDHALFWALVIALLNYIPYFGSLVAVAFPVLLSLVQFGSLTLTLVLLVALTTAQMWVGNWLEPRMIGRTVNMSPFVVVAALAFWTTFWGVPGAILAVPLTSMLAIIFAAFDQTRPLAVLLAQDVTEFETAPAQQAPVRPAPARADA